MQSEATSIQFETQLLELNEYSATRFYIDKISSFEYRERIQEKIGEQRPYRRLRSNTALIIKVWKKVFGISYRASCATTY